MWWSRQSVECLYSMRCCLASSNWCIFLYRCVLLNRQGRVSYSQSFSSLLFIRLELDQQQQNPSIHHSIRWLLLCLLLDVASTCVCNHRRI
jgi:hypothetical protein